jgi:hypothetical protein
MNSIQHTLQYLQQQQKRQQLAIKRSEEYQKLLSTHNGRLKLKNKQKTLRSKQARLQNALKPLS